MAASLSFGNEALTGISKYNTQTIEDVNRQSHRTNQFPKTQELLDLLEAVEKVIINKGFGATKKDKAVVASLTPQIRFSCINILNGMKRELMTTREVSPHRELIEFVEDAIVAAKKAQKVQKAKAANKVDEMND